MLEVPGGDFEQLVRMRPIVADRRQFLVADGESLVNDGFLCCRHSTHRTGRSCSPPRLPASSSVCELTSVGRSRIRPTDLVDVDLG